MAEVDSLSISISASAEKANSSIDKLIGKLDTLAGSLKIDTSSLSSIGNIAKNSGIKDFSAQVGKLSKGLQGFNNIDTSKLTEVSNSIKDLSEEITKAGSQSSGTDGISKIVNSINRLGKTDLSSIKPENFERITKSIASLAAMPDVSNSVNRFVSSVSRIANSGERAGKAASALPELGRQLRKTVTAMSGVKDISESTNAFVSSISRLSNAGNKTGQTAGQLKDLSQGVLEFMRSMQNAPQISESTIRMTEAISRLSSSGGKVSAVSKTVSNSFSRIAGAADSAYNSLKKVLGAIGTALSKTFSGIGNLGKRAASSIKNTASNIAASFRKIGDSSKHLKTASFNLGTLLKTAIGFKGIQALNSFARSAIELGSDITEVENVVDVAFGGMAQHAYDFAATATEQFGLSELAAKQYAGTMMAMLKSSGVAQGAAAQMSTTLAGLAGDLASFYNLDTDTAFYKIRAGISGEIEPLKQLGINMSVANLEAFAMSKGINKAYKEMSQAEKTILRYNYLLSVTADQQGDFARTAGTWANQVRLLKLNFQSLASIIGQGLISALLPVVKWLNALMAKLMGVAKAFRDFMYTLMGKKLEASTGGAVSGIEDVNTGLEDMEETAEDAAKKLHLLGIDELNVLADSTEDLSDELPDFSELGNIGDILSGKDDSYDVNEWAKKIRDAFLNQDWEGLGRTIAELINKGLSWLYKKIKQITPKVEKALKNLAKVINSFIDNLDWDLFGKTIGAGINLLVKSFNALFGDDGIDFENLGRKLSDGLRGMIGEVDWVELGNAIGNYLMIAWRIASGFIEDMWRIDPNTLLTGWAEAGIAIGETLAGIFERINFEQISAVLTEGFKGALETFTYALNTFSDNLDWIVDKINLGLDRLYDGLKWDSTAGEDMGQKITAFTDAISRAFNKLLDIDFGRIGQIIGAAVTDIVRAFNQLTDIESNGIDFEKIGKKISDGLRGLVTEIPWEEFGNALGNGFMVSWRILDGFLNDMAKKSNVGLTGWQELGVSLGNAVNGIFDKIDFGELANVLVSGFNGIIETLRNFIDTIDWISIATNLTNGLNTLIHGIDWANAGATLNELFKNLLNVFWEVTQNTDWEGLGRGIGEALSNIDWMNIIGTVFDIIWEVFSGFISGLFGTSAGKVIIAFTAGLTALTGVFKLVDIGTKAYEWIWLAADVLSGLGGLIMEKVVPSVASAIEHIAGEGGLFSKIVTAAKSAFSGAGILEKIGTVLFSPKGLMIMGIVAGVAIIVANWDKVSDVAKKLWEDVLVPFGNFLKDVFVKIWDDMIKPAMQYIAENVVPKLIEVLREFWDNVLVPLGNFILDVFTPVFDVLADVLESLWKNVIVPVSNAVGGVFASAFKMLCTILTELVMPVLSEIIKVLQILWDNLMKPIVEWVRDTLGPILEQVFESVGSTISELMDTLSGLIDFLSGVIGGIGDVLTTMIGTISEILGNLFDVFSGIIDFVVGIFTGDWERAWNGVVEIFRGIFNLIPSIAEGVINSVIGFINGIIHGINNVTGIAGIPSIPDISKVELPRFATGGFPEDGLFYANHTELVGRFSNGKTAVANNEQIIAGIEEAAYRGFARASAENTEEAGLLRELIEAVREGKTISVDGRELTEIVGARAARNGYVFQT